MMLEDEGYDVDTAMDEKVISMVEKNCPDLLLLDIWMSGADGREICRKLKKNAKTRNVPVILVSANKDTGKHAMEAGADGFLSKPFEIEELLKIVRKHMD